VSTPAPPRQRWPLYIGAVIVALIVLLAVLRHHMQPEQLSATLLAQASEATGLDLKLAHPADVSLWPDLNIVLRGLEARAEPGARPILRVERVEIALPWSSLWREQLEITALRLMRPQLDRDALRPWLNQRAGSGMGPAAPPRLPRLSAELRVQHGRVHGRSDQAWRVDEIDLSLSRLIAGEDFRLSLGFEYREGEQRQPFRLESAGRLHSPGMPLELAPLAIRWLDADGSERLRLNGQLELAWPHRLQFDLAGRGSEWPEAWSSFPARSRDAEAAYELRLAFLGTPQGAGPLQLEFGRGEGEARFEGDAAQLMAWLDQPGSRLPPLRGEARAPRLQQGGLLLEGLRLELGEDREDEP
jgi:hypothetical protein